MKLFLLLALLASPAYAVTGYDCNGDWIDPSNPNPPNPPCRQSAPEMSDWLALAFLVGGGAWVMRARKREIRKESA